jgi:hypothetical protein
MGLPALDCIKHNDHYMIICDSYVFSSAGMERRHNMPQHPRTTKKVTPQDTIETIAEHVEGTAADHTTG